MCRPVQEMVRNYRPPTFSTLNCGAPRRIPSLGSSYSREAGRVAATSYAGHRRNTDHNCLFEFFLCENKSGGRKARCQTTVKKSHSRQSNIACMSFSCFISRNEEYSSYLRQQ